MVAGANRASPSTIGCINCIKRGYRGCPFYLHRFLVPKVYRNILVLIAGFCVLHLLFGGVVYLAFALTILFFSASSEKLAVFIERAWLVIGEKLGHINSAILLFFIYYFILTPIAFMSGIGKKDPLQLRAPGKSNFIFKHHKYSDSDLKNPW